jgi:CheY-like chemotaxis protein
MNAIIGYTGLALKEAASPVLHNYLVKIDRSNKHLLTLINDILEMSRIENGKMEIECIPTDICRIFDDIHDLFEEQMKQKKMDFKIDTSGVKNRFVLCDEKNLNRVILNLLSNAYKFTSEGGKVYVSVSENIGEEAGFGSYEISVCDNGIGMSEEFAEKMFSPFERERTSTVSGIEGTGLGLSITKSIVDLMGGTINVITSTGNGTKIILDLKLKFADEDDIVQEENSESSHDDEILFEGKRLLLVEDNMINMEIACMILSQAGFTVDTAENGKIAVEKISASEKGFYSAVLMDVQMPVMDGYTAAKMIRELDNKDLAGIPIIAMTANAFKEDEKAALRAGMQGNIEKPIDVDVLLKTLTKVLSEYK